MSRFKKIMFATDFSPHSRRALGCAAELSARMSVPLLIVSTLQLPTYPIPDGVILRGPEVMSEMINHVRDALEDERRIAVALGAHDVETMWVEGVPATEIVRIATERAIDLIVVGSHGRGPIARAIVGSTADKIVRTAQCPVMVVAHDPPGTDH